MRHEFKRHRSEFGVIINDDDRAYNISTNTKYVDIINYFYPILERRSPTKWKKSSKHDNMHNLWLPKDCCDQMVMEDFMVWCEYVTQEVLWIYLSKNISQYFSNELDFCIALDFNYIHGNGRTKIGEAEYQLKYNIQNINDEDRSSYTDVLIDGLLNACKYIPFYNKEDWFISPMPSTEEGKQKLAWRLAESVSQELDILFLDSALTCNKPQMKELSVDKKIEVWDWIYNNNCVEIDEDIEGKNILIIDDLYQSGTTIWQYAHFLKCLGANIVFGLVCVKSLKDSDNK